MNKYHCLTVERLPEGGFVVYPARSDYNRGDYLGPLFATSSIGDALAFVEGKLDPPNPAPNQALGGLSGAAFGTQGAILRGDKSKPLPGITADWVGS